MYISEKANAKPIHVVTKSELEMELGKNSRLKSYADLYQKQLKPGQVFLELNQSLEIEKVFVQATSIKKDPRAYLFLGGDLSRKLKAGNYFLASEHRVEDSYNFNLGWGLAKYSFDDYKESQDEIFSSILVSEEDKAEMEALQEGVFKTRDLINRPGNVVDPENLQTELETLAEKFGADCNTIQGKNLIRENYPAIYAVGKASPNEPRLIELNWGDEKHPQISIVGKGVCFDSGGYDLKPSRAMRKMKKDMGGAATAIGLCHAIMANNIPVRLQLLIPAVENMVDGSALKPGDVINTRKGLKVEIDNTDAEGRLVLCDALTKAEEGQPDLIIDFATLTGACRVGLGRDFAGMFSTDQKIANELLSLSQKFADPIWQLPLWQPYKKELKSSVSDCVNSSPSGFGGAITAALYLDQFVEDTDWLHFDVYAWVDGGNAVCPSGGEALALRSVYHYLKDRFKN
ncbi:MAG: M17 family metallopeptidase [Bdellovibrionales bacterium]